MSKLPRVSHIVGTKQDTDITNKRGLLAPSGTMRPAGFAVLRQVPPDFLIHAFLRIEIAIDRLWQAQLRALADHSVAELLGRLAMLIRAIRVLHSFGYRLIMRCIERRFCGCWCAACQTNPHTSWEKASLAQKLRLIWRKIVGFAPCS